MKNADELADMLNQHLKHIKETGNGFSKRLGLQQASINRFCRRQQRDVNFETALIIIHDMGGDICFNNQIQNTREIEQLEIELEKERAISKALKEVLSDKVKPDETFKKIA